ncbi:universal stress protein [Aquibacillus koreensis]|uniref:Universal stress protein n=1 Tax=Aquibacillus koreensis TaxID=279446 RepID=A0A9X3WK85_9BACI|nr:universal stress protein [Aquibacillus koreensis]MCT2535947.1 universal stress protein [Aquibacillus koreensis]MDC3420403.1 universal stress protein [Aquibacillus koreensis]
MFNKILLASDGSEHAIRAADNAIALARNIHAKITIAYVVDIKKSKANVLHNRNSICVERNRKELLMLTEQKMKRENVKYEVKILSGEAGPTIVKYANENDVDICVIGSRGLHSLQEMVLGSVSHKVAKRVACPVMIVK